MRRKSVSIELDFNWIRFSFDMRIRQNDKKCWVGRPMKLNTIKSISQYKTTITWTLCYCYTRTRIVMQLNEWIRFEMTLSKGAITHTNFWECSSTIGLWFWGLLFQDSFCLFTTFYVHAPTDRRHSILNRLAQMIWQAIENNGFDCIVYVRIGTTKSTLKLNRQQKYRLDLYFYWNWWLRNDDWHLALRMHKSINSLKSHFFYNRSLGQCNAVSRGHTESEWFSHFGSQFHLSIFRWFELEFRISNDKRVI